MLLRFVFFSLLISTIYCPVLSQKIDSLEALASILQGKTKIETLNNLSKEWLDNDPVKAREYAQIALDLSKSTGYPSGIITSYKNIGLGYREENNFLKAIEFLSLSYDLAKKSEGDLKQAAVCALNIGTLYFRQNDYSHALKFYLECFSIHEKLGNKVGEGKALSGIGLVYMRQSNFDKALEINFKALEVFEELHNDQEIARMHNVIANTYDEKGDLNHALEYYLKAKEKFELTNYLSGKISTLTSIGDIYRKQKQWDKALDYLEKSLALNANKEHPRTLPYTLKLMGDVYYGKGNLEKAIEYLSQSIPLSKDIKLRENLSEAYHSLAETYKSLGNYKQAYEYHDLYVIYYDSVFDVKKNEQIAEMQTRFETVQKEKEIEVLKHDKVLNRVYLITEAISLLAIFVIAFLLINRQRLRTKKNAEIVKQEKRIFEVELEKQKEVQQRLHQEIEFNNKSLTAYTLNLIHKNEMLEDIKSQVEIIRRAPDREVMRKLQNLFNTVNYSIHLDKDWENFRTHFEQVHLDFFDKLRSRFPELNSNDMKLCSLLRLNLETKQIATLLDISFESTKVARSRLRKKMELQTEQNLQEFLATF
jgi:tetratricopeptide (TPR) repeat protein